MAGLNQQNNNDEDLGTISQINVTPFVDVVLVLLVIFMVTAPIVLKDILPVNLPKAANAMSTSTPPLAFSITESGVILLYGKPIEESEVAELVKKAMAENPESQAIISADENAKHKYVVHMIDLLKSAGLERFALEVEHTQ